MTDLDHTCRTAIESGRMARVALSRFPSEADDNARPTAPARRAADTSRAINSDGAAIGAVKRADAPRLPNAAGVEPAPSEPHPKRYLRPNCQHRDMCRSGTSDHCGACRRAIQEAGQ
ncbi:hypothetical protein GCM10007908_03390 [Rhizobium albus]|nr:hypothetical protein GCM10007908_03390 [Rhizobium albus]